MIQAVRRNRLLPWYIGCPAPVLLEFAVLVVIPIVYLTLMYLTFVSQE